MNDIMPTYPSMNAYELVMILKDDKEATVKKIADLLSEKKGSIEKKENWGKKSFSYPIKKMTAGYYLLWNIKAPQDAIQDLKKRLDYNEEVIRYLLIKL